MTRPQITVTAGRGVGAQVRDRQRGEQATPAAPRSLLTRAEPDEWVWKNVKYDRAGKTVVTSKDDLNRSVCSRSRFGSHLLTVSGHCSLETRTREWDSFTKGTEVLLHRARR
jgi:hypothetical protein